MDSIPGVKLSNYDFRNTEFVKKLENQLFEEQAKNGGIARVSMADIQSSRAIKTKKRKPDYRLYPIYQGVVGMLDKCQKVLDELFVYSEKQVLAAEGPSDATTDEGWVYTNTAQIFAGISSEKAELIKEILTLWLQVKNRPDAIRDGWVRDKVPQNRYSRQGQDYVIQLEEVGNMVFGLSALIVDFQTQLQNVVMKNGGIDE